MGRPPSPHLFLICFRLQTLNCSFVFFVQGEFRIPRRSRHFILDCIWETKNKNHSIWTQIPEKYLNKCVKIEVWSSVRKATRWNETSGPTDLKTLQKVLISYQDWDTEPPILFSSASSRCASWLGVFLTALSLQPHIDSVLCVWSFSSHHSALQSSSLPAPDRRARLRF